MFISGVEYGAPGHILHFGYFWRGPKPIFTFLIPPKKSSVSKKEIKMVAFFGGGVKIWEF